MRCTARLTWRQQQLYTGRMDLFAPSTLDVTDDQSATDMKYGPLAKYTDVPCYRKDSLEDNEASPIGRGQGDLVITLTEFRMAFGQELGDGWLVRFHLPEGIGGGEKYRNYIVQGSPRYIPASGGRNVNAAAFFALECGPVRTIQDGLLSATAKASVELLNAVQSL